MTKDWTRIYKKYPGMWVALDAGDEATVVAANKDAKKAHEAGVASGKEVVLHRVPETVITFAGYEVRV